MEAEHPKSISLNRGSITFTTAPTPRLIFTSPNRTEARELVLFGDAVKNLIFFLPKALTVAKSITGDQLQLDQENIFSETLSCYTAQTLQMKNVLSVNCYNGYVNIWIRRFFLASETHSWHTCKGGYQITLNDSEEYILDFLKSHIETLKPTRKIVGAL